MAVEHFTINQHLYCRNPDFYSKSFFDFVVWIS